MSVEPMKMRVMGAVMNKKKEVLDKVDDTLSRLEKEIKGMMEEKKEGKPKAVEKKEEKKEDLSLDAWMRQLVEIYLEEEGEGRTVEEVEEAGDYSEILEEAILENGGHDNVARKAMANLIKKGRSKASLLEEMREMKEDGYTMFDDILEEEEGKADEALKKELEAGLKDKEKVKKLEGELTKVAMETRQKRKEISEMAEKLPTPNKTKPQLMEMIEENVKNPVYVLALKLKKRDKAMLLKIYKHTKAVRDWHTTNNPGKAIDSSDLLYPFTG